MKRRRTFSGIPIKNKVRREKNSPNFKLTGKGLYSIIHNGEKISINATTEKKNNLVFIRLREKNGGFIGSFVIRNNGGKSELVHRIVPQWVRGYNLGKLGFRLAEQQAKKSGAKEIELTANQKQVLCVALSIGYKIAPEHEWKIRRLLGLPEKKPLKTQEIIQFFQNPSQPEPIPDIRIIRKIK